MSAVKTSLNINDFYESYLLRNPAKDKKVNQEEFKQILYSFGDIITTEVVATGKSRFPISCWMLRIFRNKNHSTDRRLSSIYKAPILNFNDHTQGYVMKVRLQTTDAINKKRKHYLFKATRSLTRTKLAKTIFENPAIIHNYEIVENIKYIKT